MPSPEIRDAIEMNSWLRKTFVFVIVLNKYDVFAVVPDQVLIQPAVQEIKDLGEMIVVCANTQQRLTAKMLPALLRPLIHSYGSPRHMPSLRSSVPPPLFGLYKATFSQTVGHPAD